jgi:hypothetical protein
LIDDGAEPSAKCAKDESGTIDAADELTAAPVVGSRDGNAGEAVVPPETDVVADVDVVAVVAVAALLVEVAVTPRAGT